MLCRPADELEGARVVPAYSNAYFAQRECAGLRPVRYNDADIEMLCSILAHSRSPTRSISVYFVRHAYCSKNVANIIASRVPIACAMLVREMQS